MSYRATPRGCRFSTDTTKTMVPVSLDDMAVQGTRAQRRFAKREIRKLEKKREPCIAGQSGKHGD